MLLAQFQGPLRGALQIASGLLAIQREAGEHLSMNLEYEHIRAKRRAFRGMRKLKTKRPIRLDVHQRSLTGYKMGRLGLASLINGANCKWSR